jgi:hypothetical protein
MAVGSSTAEIALSDFKHKFLHVYERNITVKDTKEYTYNFNEFLTWSQGSYREQDKNKTFPNIIPKVKPTLTKTSLLSFETF